MSGNKEWAILYLTVPTANLWRSVLTLELLRLCAPSVHGAPVAAPQTKSCPCFRFPPKSDILTTQSLTHLLGPKPRFFRHRNHIHLADSCRSGPTRCSAHREGATAMHATPTYRSPPFRPYPFFGCGSVDFCPLTTFPNARSKSFGSLLISRAFSLVLASAPSSA